jgi:UDPglucose 6-dehydrogenase
MTNKPVIGIMGTGMVGGAIQGFFQTQGNEIIAYDPPKGLNDVVALGRADFIFICVPTPYDEAAGGFDLSYVDAAFKIIPDGKTVIIKSTVLPGTTEKYQTQFPRLKILFNPEFLTESSADQDMRFPDRQIIGFTKESFIVAGDVMQILPLAPFERIIPATEAEMVKYFGNTWFSTKVVFANQMYDVCTKLGISYDTVKESAAADKRIGRSHLEIFHKGFRGYGGKCLPKDTRALIQLGDRLGLSLDLLKTAEIINNKLVKDSNNEKDR